MRVLIKEKMYHKTVLSIQEQVGGQIEEDCHEHSIILPKKYGEGKFRGTNFQNGVGVFVGDVCLQEGIDLIFDQGDPHPLRFNFCLTGQLTHRFDNGDFFYHLNSLMGSITANSNASEQLIRIPINQRVVFVVIDVDRKAYYEKVKCEVEELPDKFSEVFQDVEGKKPFLYQSNYSVPVAEAVEEINNNAYKGLVRRTFIESKVLETMSLIIKQYLDDLSQSGKQSLLKQYDMEKIVEAKKILKERLSNPPTIVELSKLIGLNQQKLKTGFKHVYGTTINKYQQKIRLEKSQLLLLEGSRSIGEIAQLIGYSNGSHFSRLFKKRFGSLPREYQKNLMNSLNNHQELDEERVSA